MNESAPPETGKKPGGYRWMGWLFFLLAVFMYVSIMIKIIKFGP